VVTDRVFAFKRGPKTTGPRAPNDDAEHRFQVSVATYLKFALPDEYRFTASAAGVKVGMQTAVKMKAAGQQRGWPDLIIRNRKTGACRWLELKAKGGRPTPEQQVFIDEVPGHTAVCRTLEEVESALIGWGITPKCSIEGANRYG
jgi:hypothetical protein